MQYASMQSGDRRLVSHQAVGPHVQLTRPQKLATHVLGRGRRSHVDGLDRDALVAVVLKQRLGAEPEAFHASSNRSKVVVGASVSVVSDVGANALNHGLRRAFQVDDHLHANKGLYVACLAGVSRQTIQNHPSGFCRDVLGQESAKNAGGDGELAVLQQRPRGQDAADDIDVGGIKRWRRLCGRSDPAELCAEIEVHAGKVPEAVVLEVLAERRFAGSGRADQEQCLLCHERASAQRQTVCLSRAVAATQWLYGWLYSAPCLLGGPEQNGRKSMTHGRLYWWALSDSNRPTQTVYQTTSYRFRGKPALQKAVQSPTPTACAVWPKTWRP